LHYTVTIRRVARCLIEKKSPPGNPGSRAQYLARLKFDTHPSDCLIKTSSQPRDQSHITTSLHKSQLTQGMPSLVTPKICQRYLVRCEQLPELGLILCLPQI
jgi:hypothetical protein